MKRFFKVAFRILLVLGFLMGGATLISLIQKDTGYVLVRVGGYVIETSFWAGAAFFMGGVVLTYLTWRLMAKVFGLFFGGISRFKQARVRRAEQRTQAGLIHFIEGNWLAAKKDLMLAAKRSDKPLIQYLAAARSAYELGHLEDTNALLQKAEKAAPEHDLAIALSQARIQLLDQKYEQCLATLERIRQKEAHNPVVLDLLKQVYIQLCDWDAMNQLLPELRASKQYSAQDMKIIEHSTYKARLVQAAAQGVSGEEDHPLVDVWHQLPRTPRKDSELIEAYLRLLLEQGLAAQAEPIIKAQLKKTWTAKLITLYGRVPFEDPQAQLLSAERWLRERPNDADLLFALARIACRAEQYDKSQSYFDSGLKLQERSDMYTEYAALMAKLGEHEVSTQLYQKGTALPSAHLPLSH